MPDEVASPGAISLLGINSVVTLATVVGFLVEVPIMLILVNSIRKYFKTKVSIA